MKNDSRAFYDYACALQVIQGKEKRGSTDKTLPLLTVPVNMPMT